MLINATQHPLPPITPVNIAQGHPTIITFPLGILRLQFVLSANETRLLLNPHFIPYILNQVYNAPIWTTDSFNWTICMLAGGLTTVPIIVKSTIRQWLTNEVCHVLDVKIITNAILIKSKIIHNLGARYLF